MKRRELVLHTRSWNKLLLMTSAESSISRAKSDLTASLRSVVHGFLSSRARIIEKSLAYMTFVGRDSSTLNIYHTDRQGLCLAERQVRYSRLLLRRLVPEIRNSCSEKSEARSEMDAVWLDVVSVWVSTTSPCKMDARVEEAKI
jgi:hypothetical protein